MGLLALRLYEGEHLLIGENVVVQVVEVFGGKVKLAIAAPRDVVILRDRVARRVAPELARRAQAVLDGKQPETPAAAEGETHV